MIAALDGKFHKIIIQVYSCPISVRWRLWGSSVLLMGFVIEMKAMKAVAHRSLCSVGFSEPVGRWCCCCTVIAGMLMGLCTPSGETAAAASC